MSDDTEVLDTQGEDVVEQEAIEPAEKSMDDTIRETLANIEARDRGDETEQEKVDRRKTRERGPDGKYLPKDAAPEETPAEVEPQQAAPSDAAPVTVPPELQRLGLRKEEAEAFAKADQVVRDAFVRRSEEMHKGLEQFRTKAQFGHAMEQAIAPFMATIQAIGATPETAVKTLMVADHNLRYGTPQQKTEMLLKIAKDYGVDLNQVQQYQAEQPYVDPQVTQLQQQLQQMQSWVVQQNQQREWQERQALNSDIGKFASDPANEYFEHVRNDMAGLLQAGLATDLKDAYEKAIYANPTIRAQVLAKQQAQEAEKRKAMTTQTAQAAKKAASVNMPRRGLMPAAKPVGSMDDTIRETAQRLGII